MKGNVSHTKNDKRVCKAGEKNIVKFLKYFRNISWNISGQKKFREILHH